MEFKMTESGFMTEAEYGKLHISPDNERGFRPFQLMVSSIAGCSAIVLRKVLSRMRLSVKDIQVSVQIARNSEEANRIEELHLHFAIQGKDLSEKKVERALNVARKNCAMVQSVQSSIQVTETFELV